MSRSLHSCFAYPLCSLYERLFAYAAAFGCRRRLHSSHCWSTAYSRLPTLVHVHALRRRLLWPSRLPLTGPPYADCIFSHRSQLRPDFDLGQRSRRSSRLSLFRIRGCALAETVKMRIPIREQLAGLILLAAAIGLAVISIATWVCVSGTCLHSAPSTDSCPSIPVTTSSSRSAPLDSP